VTNYLQNDSAFLYWTGFLFGVSAVLWNLDTGLVVLLSWVLILFYIEIAQRNYLKLIRHALVTVLILAVGSVMFVLYMKLRYHAFPDLSTYFKYQKIFYQTGFYMLPMPVIHPWNLLVVIYTSGLAYAISLAIHGELSVKGGISFFLSILGIGLFSYYQGRSASTNLAFVAYPAIMLLVIYADSLIARSSVGFGPAKISFSIIISAFIYCTMLLIVDLPVFGRQLYSQILPDDVHKKNWHSRTEQFVLEHAPNNGKMLILSGYSGYYQLVSNSNSSVVFPSHLEFILVDDYKKLYDFLVANRDIPVMIGSEFIADSNTKTYGIIEVLKSSYRSISVSPDKNMYLFTR
jgi:hypothetical protein